MFKFNPFRKQSKAGDAGDNGTADKTNATADEATMKDQATDIPKDAPKPDAADAPKADNAKTDKAEGKAWHTYAKYGAGALGLVAVAGVGYMIVTALRESDNAAVAAAGEAVAAGAEAVVEASTAVVGESVAAMFSK